MPAAPRRHPLNRSHLNRLCVVLLLGGNPLTGPAKPTETSAPAETVANLEIAYADLEKEIVAKLEVETSAADFDLLFKQLATLSRPNLASNPQVEKFALLRDFVAHWQDYLVYAAQGNTEQADRTLRSIVQLGSRLAFIPRSRIPDLLKETMALGNSDREAAIAARLTALRQQLTSLVKSAKGAADFDDLLSELAQPLQSNGVMIRPDDEQLEPLRRGAARWQDYYGELEAGHDEFADDILRELSNDTIIDPVLYPRDRIQTLRSGRHSQVDSPHAVELLIAPTELTMDNLPKFQQQFSRLQKKHGGEPITGLEDLADTVERLVYSAGKLKTGLGDYALYGLNYSIIILKISCKISMITGSLLAFSMNIKRSLKEAVK